MVLQVHYLGYQWYLLNLLLINSIEMGLKDKSVNDK
jgi:hypothetical protein